MTDPTSTADRYSGVKPMSSKWADGWLQSMTSIEGFEMVRHPGERPFVMTRDEWDALPEEPRTGRDEAVRASSTAWARGTNLSDPTMTPASRRDEVEASARRYDPEVWALDPPDISSAKARRQSILEAEVRLGHIRYSPVTDTYETVDRDREHLGQKIGSLRWITHDKHFHSLMLGRIEIAQINKARTTDDWFYYLRFTQGSEQASFSEPNEENAKAVCVAHAAKVLV